MILVAQSVAGGDIFNSDDGGNVARITGLDILAFVRIDLNQTPYALTLVRAWIIDRVALRERAGINPEEYELANEGIAPKFECKGAEISVVVGGRLHRLMRIRLHAFRRRNIQRAGQ